jgi:Xaa-Pro aminopeptidase
MTVGERTRTAGWLPSARILESHEADSAIWALRERKDPGELALIQAAQGITDGCFSYILNFIKPGRTEREIALEMFRHMMEQGAEGLAFDTICVSGVNSSLPHGVPTERRLEAGDFLTMDFGAMVGGYCSDMTRTVAIGHVTEEMSRVYHTVLEAQRKAIAAVKKGMICSQVDKRARNIIYGAGYEGCFGHGLGHSVGLDIHEEPRFSPACGRECQEGMILTVEPGIYLEGKFGCRIEDMVFIGEDSVLNLTHSPKELMIL